MENFLEDLDKKKHPKKPQTYYDLLEVDEDEFPSLIQKEIQSVLKEFETAQAQTKFGLLWKAKKILVDNKILPQILEREVRDQMCLWYLAEDPATKESIQALVPLTNVSIKGNIIGPLANIKAQFTFTV